MMRMGEFQMIFDTTALARRRVLQWVAAAGLRIVALNTARSLAALMMRGRPARGRLRNPASPASR